MALKIAAVVLVFVGFLAVHQQNAFAFNGEVFEITGSGTITHFHDVTAGTKPFVNKVTAAMIVQCIQGTAGGCTDGVTIVADPDGKAYVYFFSDTEWGIATQPDLACGSGSITHLDGLVAGTGLFVMEGQHTLSGSTFVIHGTVSFVKGTKTPTSMKKASILGVAEGQQHSAVGTVATVGAAVDNCHNH